MRKSLGFLAFIGYALAVVFAIASGRSHEGNWLLGPASPVLVRVCVTIAVVFVAVFVGFVGYMRLRERREYDRQFGASLDPGPGEETDADNVITMPDRRPAPPTAPMPAAVGDDD